MKLLDSDNENRPAVAQALGEIGAAAKASLPWLKKISETTRKDVFLVQKARDAYASILGACRRITVAPAESRTDKAAATAAEAAPKVCRPEPRKVEDCLACGGAGCGLCKCDAKQAVEVRRKQLATEEEARRKAEAEERRINAEAASRR